ncbi:MAG: hypothetical protein E7603_07830 [Ruminococcaceae bacterium]|nr:hypothetical protein [Oscillospiraceae bacterium]
MIFAKILFMLGMLALMAIPFVIEYFRFRKDKETLKVSRFRTVVFAVLYTAAATLVLLIFTRISEWLGSLSLIQWILKNTGTAKTDYAAELYVVILVNVLLGFGFFLLQSVVRTGLRKMDVTTPKNEEVFTRVQQFERKLIARFNTKKWYFVGRLLKGLCLALSALYGLLFLLYQCFAMFEVPFLPYEWIRAFFALTYRYPVLGLLFLWEIAFFLLAIQAFAERCPGWKDEEKMQTDPMEESIRAVDEDCRKNFGAYYAASMELKTREPVYSADHEKVSEIIGKTVENDVRNAKTAKDIYISALDRMERTEKSILFNGGFFSEFSMYFFRYLSVGLARGDRLLFVCNTDIGAEKTYRYLYRGLCEISGLYDAKNTDERLRLGVEHPIWKIVTVSGAKAGIDEHEVAGASVLITTPDFLCSDVFEEMNADSAAVPDTVIFTDTVAAVNRYEKQLLLLHVKLLNMRKQSPVRYYFFDETRTPGVDKTLKNMFASEIETVDIMENCYRAMVSCYNYNSVSGEAEAVLPHFIPSDENIGVMMEMAVNCIACGAASASVFVEETLPYQAIEESIRANIHKLRGVSLGKNLHINEYAYNPDRYSVILAMDAGNNLPSALRKYISMTTDKPALVILFSRPYLFRDYYIENMEKLWQGNQILRIPVTESTEKDIAEKILMQAGSGGISKEELLALASGMPSMEAYAQSRNIRKILEMILELFGVRCTEPSFVYRYFEYTSFRDFDRNGKYAPETKITLRSKHMLYDIIRMRDRITLRTASGETYELPLSKKRLTQNYIEGQNLIYGGEIYCIRKIDTKKGEIYAELAGGGYNSEVYSYIQSRTYRLDGSALETEFLYPPKRTSVNVRKRGKTAQETELREVCLSAFRVPAEVLTSGYYDVDPQSMDRTACEFYHAIDGENEKILSVQTYRRYGNFKNPTYSGSILMEEQKLRELKKSRYAGNRKLSDIELNVSMKGISVLSVRLCGSFGEKRGKIASLAAVMLDEILRAKFPCKADSLAVCAVNGAEDEIIAHMPRVEFVAKEYGSEEDVELLILEDCAEDLGVISVLMTSGDNILHTLFAPIKEYLDWYMKKEDRSHDYLWFGQEAEPACFDFAALHTLSCVLGDVKNKFHYQEIENIAEYHVCDFCGKRYADKNDLSKTVDDRIICRHCARELVGNNKATLKAYLDRAKFFMEMKYGIALENTYEFCFDSTAKIIHAIRRNEDLRVRNTEITAKSYISDQTVHAEYELPSANLAELLVRELTHVWQIQNLPDLEEDLAKGHIALVGIQYLRYLKQHALADVRTQYYESSESEAAEGYRNLTGELMKNPQYGNNPFLYLMGDESAMKRRLPDPNRIHGTRYKTKTPDRTKENLSYYYYERLPEPLRDAYTQALEALRAHAETFCHEAFTEPENIKTVLLSIEYDHPELFWYTGNYSYYPDGTVKPCYSMTAEEAEAMQARMEPVIAEYLEGITDDMSAYDVALQLYIKLINRVDYDTVALDIQKKEGLERDELDELRTICGVFLNETTVCEGYARAYQYLMQKCGVECAECAGMLTREGGGAHAWNLIKLDGDYYHMDVTWGDSSNTKQEVKNENIGFNYFCITTEELLRTRDLSLNPIEIPAFTATKCNYHYHNDLVLTSYDFKKIRNILTSAIKKEEGYCTFKCSSAELFEEVHTRLFENPTPEENIWEAARKIRSNAKISCFTNSEIYTVTIYID